jgi:hypothetical protein
MRESDTERTRKMLMPTSNTSIGCKYPKLLLRQTAEIYRFLTDKAIEGILPIWSSHLAHKKAIDIPNK